MHVLVTICICVLGYSKLEALGALMIFFEFFSLCLFYAIVELHVINEKYSSTFYWKVKVDFICKKDLFNS